MLLKTARPFAEAMQSREARALLPTTLRTRDLDRLSPEVREQAMFSAAVTDARFLQTADDAIRDLLTGDISQADARLRIDAYLDSIGHEGQTLSTDLTDLRSLARKNVLLETNLGLALGYGQWAQGQEPTTLNLWPAQELVRVENRREPRTDWPERFRAAGGTIWQGRLIALTNSPVWATLSRFGYPYPPFDFGSGMGLRPVTRADAVAAGLLEEDDDMIPEDRGIAEAARTPVEIRETRLREAVARELKGIAEFRGSDLVKLAPDFSQSAASLSRGKLVELRAPTPDPAPETPGDAIARLQAGVEVEDVTGETRRLDLATFRHWAGKADELKRAAYLARAEATLRAPVEVWDQGNQIVYLNTFLTATGGVRGFGVFVRPSGTVDNFFTSKFPQLEKARRGRTLLYAAE